MFAVKEKPAVSLSLNQLEQLQEANEVVIEAKERAQKLHPTCPDGSGETGIFDQKISDLNGGIAIYRTPSGKYFHWIETIKRGQVLNPEFIRLK